MATVSGSTSYSASRGMSGLVSGLDTESMVEKLLSGTQAKIDRQKAAKQQLIWKQDSYRDIISNINSFQDKFFSFSNPKTNLFSSGFYNAMNASTKSTAVKVNASNNASAGKITIKKVEHLATASKYESANTLSNELSGKIDFTKIKDQDEGAKIDITLDGIKKTVTLKGTTDAEVLESLKDGLKNAFGDKNIEVVSDANGFKFKTINSTSQVTVSANTDTQGLEALGFKNNQSNKISTVSKLGDLNIKTPLQGSQFEFVINDKTITATADDTIQSVMEKINTSGAGVKVTYSTINDKFTIESTETGAGREINISDTTGNLMSAMFGTKSSGAVSGKPITASSITATNAHGKDLETDTIKAGSVFTITVNGKEEKFTIGKVGEDDIVLKDAITELNKQLKAKYGDDISISQNGDNFDISTKNGKKVSFTGGTDDLSTTLGFTQGQTNEISGTRPVSDFGISGSFNIKVGDATTTIDTAGKTVTELLDSIKAALPAGAEVTLKDDGSISIAGVTSDVTLSDVGNGNALSTLFGSSSVSFNQGGSLVEIQKGKNAKIVLDDGSPDGMVIERATNNFDINGVNVEILEKTSEAIVIDIDKNTDQIFDGIKSFVDEYNKLIEKLHSVIDEESSYRKYAPLTAEQKADMSDKEIELWEEKAKTGLLRNDPIISGFLSDMRSILYQKPEGAKFALYEIGITTGSWNENGKLNIDEAKLKEAIANNSSEIEKLFIDKDKGIATQLNKTLDKVAKKSSASPGTLVQMAGVKGFGSESSSRIAKQMKDIDDILERLNLNFEKEQARYWKQFNAMESVINNMNQQSSWLSSQF